MMKVDYPGRLPRIRRRVPRPPAGRGARADGPWTGGALPTSMLTTVFGIGVLVPSAFPAIGQFGTLAGSSVVDSFVASLVVFPSAVVALSSALAVLPSALAVRAEVRGGAATLAPGGDPPSGPRLGRHRLRDEIVTATRSYRVTIENTLTALSEPLLWLLGSVR